MWHRRRVYLCLRHKKEDARRASSRYEVILRDVLSVDLNHSSDEVEYFVGVADFVIVP